MRTRVRSRHRSRRVAALVTALVMAGSAGYPATGSAARQAVAPNPNIIFVLVDDMSAELLRYTDTIAGLANGGTRFTNFYVTNSLCCPSRASTFTGNHPHTTGVRTNKGSDGGGYQAFAPHEDDTYAPALHNRDYRTGYFGKYINEYPFGPNYDVPPGWDEWHVAGPGGYNEYEYRLTRYIPAENTGKQLTSSTGEYLVDELGDRAVKFLQRSREHTPNKAFFMQLSPFAPHARLPEDNRKPRFPPAVRDRPQDEWPNGEFPHGDCGGPDCYGIDVADLPAFDEPDVMDKPSWVSTRPEIHDNAELFTELRHDFRNRIRMMQAIDDMVRQVLTALTPAEKSNTYIMFSSDNGFHLGQHRLPRGKSSAYDHDTRVPLLVRRPEPAQGTIVNDQIVQNIDLYATFVDIANGAEPAPTGRDGRSLLPLINGQHPAGWRDAALIQHLRPNPNAPGAPDPDFDAVEGGGPPTYYALRTATDLYVKYPGVSDTEYYDIPNDAHQERNDRDHPRAGQLAGPLENLAHCGQDGFPNCWAAAHLPPP